MMRFALAALLIAHGVAHLVGFVVPWKLMTTEELPYRTTMLGSAIDVGDAGVRAVGVVGWPETRIGPLVNAVLVAAIYRS